MKRNHLRELGLAATAALQHPESPPNVRAAAARILRALRQGGEIMPGPVRAEDLPPAPQLATDLARMALAAIQSTPRAHRSQQAAVDAAAGALIACFPEAGLAERALDVIDTAACAGFDPTPLVDAVRPWGRLRGALGSRIRQRLTATTRGLRGAAAV